MLGGIKFTKAGGPEVLELVETQVSAPGPHEVRIKAIGLNRAESMWRKDKYIEPLKFPAGLGYRPPALSMPWEKKSWAFRSVPVRKDRCDGVKSAGMCARGGMLPILQFGCELRQTKKTKDKSMANRPKILVVGATGQVGKVVVQHLKADPDIEVIAAARTPEKAKGLGVPVERLDLDKVETIEPALKGIDRAFLATGYTVDMMRQSKSFLNAAKRQGVKHLVHLGACGDNETQVDHYAWHQFIERYVEWCGFSFTHLRPEIFMQNMLGYGGESYITKGVIRHYIGKARWSWVDIEDLAAVAAACLLEPEKHNGQTYRLGYEAATFDEFATILTQVVGQPFSYEARSPEEFYRTVLAAGAEPAYMKCIFNNFTELTNGTAVKPDEVFDNLPAIIGRKPRTIADFARKHADQFRY